VRHAADRVRRAGRAGHVPGLAAQGAHPAAGHRAGEPHGRQEDLRLDRGLLGRVRGAARGAGNLRAERHQGRHAPQGRRAAAPADPARSRHALLRAGEGQERSRRLRGRAGARGRARRVRQRLQAVRAVAGHAAARPEGAALHGRRPLAGQDPRRPRRGSGTASWTFRTAARRCAS
jgi:hypothetical protein